jgi:hypothetical protein
MAVSDAGPEYTQNQEPAPNVSQWYDREVPDIVAGLEAAEHISQRTAARALRLLEQGQAAKALSVALAEAGG